MSSYEIIYNGKDITKDILPFVLSMTYTDKSEGESDELEIVVEDKDGLWANEWYPQKGDSIVARIKSNSEVMECGVFEVDELTGTGGSSGSSVSIKALGAGIKNKIRTKKSYAHENKTLREIANTIAAAHGMTVEGNIANIRIARVTQYRQNDLKFLKKLSHEYGYIFSIRGKKLIFSSIFDIEGASASFVIDGKNIISWSITDKTSETYLNARISYHNSKQKKVISHTQKEKSPSYSSVKSDSLEIHIRAENQQQAEIKSKVALYRTNSLQQSGTVDMPGNIIALAGNNCDLEGLGMFSGLYYISESKHTISRSDGYVTSLTVKRIALLTKEREKKNDA